MNSFRNIKHRLKPQSSKCDVRGISVVNTTSSCVFTIQQYSLFTTRFFFLTGTEWVDPEDPTVIAENELLGAAAAIEAAAKKLEQLKPRAKPKVRRPLLLVT